jgi:hypothetical protein
MLEEEPTMTLEATRYAKTGDVVKRQIADEIILVPVRKTAEELDSIYSVNQMAGAIWEMIDGKKTLAEIKTALLEKFDVTPEQLDQDLQEFVGQLRSENLIREM